MQEPNLITEDGYVRPAMPLRRGDDGYEPFNSDLSGSEDPNNPDNPVDTGESLVDERIRGLDDRISIVREQIDGLFRASQEARDRGNVGLADRLAGEATRAEADLTLLRQETGAAIGEIVDAYVDRLSRSWDGLMRNLQSFGREALRQGGRFMRATGRILRHVGIDLTAVPVGAAVGGVGLLAFTHPEISLPVLGLTAVVGTVGAGVYGAYRLYRHFENHISVIANDSLATALEAPIRIGGLFGARRTQRRNNIATRIGESGYEDASTHMANAHPAQPENPSWLRYQQSLADLRSGRATARIERDNRAAISYTNAIDAARAAWGSRNAIAAPLDNN